MLSYDVWIIVVIISFILYYAVFKEREELGCYRFSIGRQCIDEDSVYVKNTKAEVGDNCNDLVERLKSILSYHEKAGVWRRCFLISFIITIFVCVIYKINKKFNTIYHYVTLLLVSFALLYFYHNYINYHHFRNLKRNGEEILQIMKQKCFH